MLAPLTLEGLRRPHGSILRNPRICEALFFAHYIEKYGTGTLMMIRESLAHNLPEPDFAQRGGEFTIAVWRDWLTAVALAELDLNDCQKQAIDIVKAKGRITNRELREQAHVVIRTASRDLEDLVGKGVLQKVGSTGRSTFYVLARKLDTIRTNQT